MVLLSLCIAVSDGTGLARTKVVKGWMGVWKTREHSGEGGFTGSGGSRAAFMSRNLFASKFNDNIPFIFHPLRSRVLFSSSTNRVFVKAESQGHNNDLKKENTPRIINATNCLAEFRSTPCELRE